MRMSIIAVSSSIAIFAIACGGASPPAHEPGHHEETGHGAQDEADVKVNGDAKVGDKTRCPVSGEVFKVAADQPKVEHKGKTYYACCAHCQKQLQSDPEKYIKPAR